MYVMLLFGVPNYWEPRGLLLIRASPHGRQAFLGERLGFGARLTAPGKTSHLPPATRG